MPHLHDNSDQRMPQYIYDSFNENPVPVYTIKDEGSYYFIEGLPGIHFKYPSEAEDHIVNVLKGAAFAVDGELNRAGQHSSLALFENETNRLVIFRTQNEEIETLTKDYHTFLQYEALYRGYPENWTYAYKWVQYHPAFYHHLKAYPTDWILDNGWADSNQEVFLDDYGDSRVYIEHGPYNENRSGIATHDTDLDSHGFIFEEAFVEFAKKVHKKYDLNGEPRQP